MTISNNNSLNPCNLVSITVVKLITGFIFNDPRIFEEALPYLTRKFGQTDLESGIIAFNHTDYYNDEVGEGLKRKFVSFKRLSHPKNAYKLKLFTHKIEERFSVSGRRRINIDPGYLTMGKLVLLSTKDYAHRIYLNGGIYAEATLCYKDKSYRPWEWTYPDYATREYIEFFNRVRAVYMESLRRRAERGGSNL